MRPLDIGADASRRIVGGERFAPCYRAIVKRWRGRMTGRDFGRLGERLVVICNEVYHGCQVEVVVNATVPSGLASKTVSDSARGGELVEAKLDGEGALEEILKDEEKVQTLTLRVRPEFETKDLQSSFATIRWSRFRPKTLFLYAQGGPQEDGMHHSILTDLLLRKMFFVSGSVPGWNTSVRLGIKEYLDEAEGKY